jgi:hypothetical protein
MHRFPQVASPLHIEPEIRAVAEHAGENERGRRGHIAAVVAQLIDVLALHAHGVSQRALGQADRLLEFLDQDFTDRRRLAFCHQHGFASHIAVTYTSFASPRYDPCLDRKGVQATPLTRGFHETVQARAHRDARFRQALLAEAGQALLDGNLDDLRASLRSCINATIGFEKLGAALGRSPKGLMRMFGPSGNPTAENLFGVIGLLQAETGVLCK